MANKAYIEIQDLTYTEKQYGLGVTISYLNGGVAGSETVSVVDKHILVTIASGTSKASQIKTAVEASVAASALVTVTVSGTATTAQVTCKQASLSGGTALTAASKTISPLKFTAKTGGTAGNSLTITYGDGETAGSETVDVTGTDITVGIESGVTTAAQIKTAIEGDGTANALVAVTSSGPSLNQVVTVSAANTDQALSGGTAAVAPSTVVQDLTFSSDSTGTGDNGVKISYTTGATAAAEVVTYDGTDAIVQIENGVSTATQIAAACNASEDFNGAKAEGTVTIISQANSHLTAATGTVVVNDYTKLNAIAATGTVTVIDYTEMSEASATGTVEVVDYTALAQTTATASGDIMFGTPAPTDTVVVTGPDGGPYTFTMVAIDPEANEFIDAESLRLLLNAIDGIDAMNSSGTISITVEEPGAAANSWTITGTGTWSALSITFSGGQDPATLTVAGTVLTESTDWTAETSNDTTADNIVAALPAEVIGINTAGSIALTAATAGTAGNAVALVTTDETNLTISGALLTGGQDNVSITIGEHTVVQGTDFTAETDNNTTATAIADAFDTKFDQGVGDVDGDAAIITYPTTGVAGNSIAFTTDDTLGSITLSRANLSGGQDAVTITVDTNELVGGVDFNQANTSNDDAASGLATAIDTAVGEEAASATTDTVTITWPIAGVVGNAIVLSSDDTVSSITLSGAGTLSGGIDALEIVVGENTLVESTDFTAETDEDTTATNLAAAIDALSGVTATADAAVVTVVSDTFGTAGNATALETSDVTAATVSGENLAGGIAALAVAVTGTGSTAQKTVNQIATAGAVGEGADAYFKDNSGTALTSSFVRQAFGFGANKISIFNDETSGANQLIASFDGTNTHLILDPTESIVLDKYVNGIWLKYGTGAPAYRIAAV
jgi:hypothetical protein